MLQHASGFQSVFEEFVYKRTYARFLDKEGRREDWPETVARYRDFFLPRVPAAKQHEFRKVCAGIESLEVMPSMRALWTAGPALERENLAGFNCAGVAIDHPKAFAETLYLLMNGCGVGFSVERQFINHLPEVPHSLQKSDRVLPVPDSKEGWARAFGDLIKALYAGEIPEWDLSKVRPRGAKLKTFGGRASGPGPLDALFRFTVATFREAAGRKLYSVECHRICCKIAEIVVVGGVRRSACLSLSNPSDDRMRSIKSGQFWETMPELAMANNSAAWTEKPSAEIFLGEWLALIKSKSGERGIFNRASARYIAALNGRRDPNHEWLCNPCCFSGDTRLLTATGYERFDALAGKSVTIVNSDGRQTPGRVWSSGERAVVKVTFAGSPGVPGQTVVCTPDHRFMLADGSECQALDLAGKRVMPYLARRGVASRADFLAGFILGDGALPRLASPSHRGLEVYLGAKDGDVADYFGVRTGPWYSVEAAEAAEKWGLLATRAPGRELPDAANEDFMSGLWTANGCVVRKHCRAALKTTSRRLADAVLAWLKDRDVHAYVTVNKPKVVSFANGDFPCKESYGVNVAGARNLAKLSTVVRFLQEYKMAALEETVLEHAPFVRSVKPCGLREVFDFTEPETHWGVVEGLVVHNSETLLRPQSLCNLSEAVVRPGDSLEDLQRKVRFATILGVVQSTLTKFGFVRREWRRNCEEERLCGVSLTGLRDHPVLCRASDKARLWLTAMRQTAVATAEEWSKALEINMPAALTLVKPSGTVGTMLNAAPGLHTRYAPCYLRRVRVSTTDPVYRFLRDRGVPVQPEVGQELETCTTAVFEFPVRSPEHAVFRDEVSAIEQLEYWLMLQKCWCEMKPSVTVYVKDHEWLSVGAWVYDHWDWVSGIAFLPWDGGVYPLMPYEEISEAEFQARLDEMPDIDFRDLSAYECDDHTTGAKELACVGGACDLA